MTGERFQALQQALMQAFPTEGALRELLLFGMDLKLAQITTAGSLAQKTLDVIEDLESHGRLEELFRRACELRPGNHGFHEVVARYWPPSPSPPPPPAAWNTRLLDGARALPDLRVEVGRVYTLETGLDPPPRPDASPPVPRAPAGLPDGTKVTFEVSCPQAILRGHGDPTGEPVARVLHTATYEAATGSCPAARFGLTPLASGRIPLLLSLVTDNAIRGSAVLVLQVEPASSAARVDLPPAPSAGAPSPPPFAVSPAALTGPPAQLRFELTATDQIALSDGVVNEKPRDPAAPRGVLITEAINARKELVALSRAYRRDPTRPSELSLADAPAMCLRMAKAGAALHRRFFGRPGDHGTDLDTQRLARVIAEAPPGGATRLQIVAAFQPFPWAVLYDGAYRDRPLTDDPASVDLSCFWGHRFRIDRAIMGHASAVRTPVLAAPVRVQVCLNAHLDDEPGARALGVRVVDRQRALFDGMPGVTAYPPIESTDGFVAYLRSETACDLLYVFCHATAAATRDELFTYATRAPDVQAKLIFEPPPAPPVDVAAMQEHRAGPLLGRPLVFLNACSTAAGDEAFQAPLLEQFLDRWGAIGVLGTDWEVPAVFAGAFARRLLDHFLRARAPLGEALWRASHEAFAEGNPFPLVYALYARPDLIAGPVAAPTGGPP
ncbi:MAG TPA: effector-associated domain EAD1-containing protein [Kofleriaceae bacterium]|nr:effector-associated domain EAD1-containing protein [Kofleriaceae bacterium]